jgi:hypothetical protein
VPQVHDQDEHSHLCVFCEASISSDGCQVCGACFDFNIEMV